MLSPKSGGSKFLTEQKERVRERPRNTSDDEAREKERAKKGDEKESKALKRTARWTEWEMDRERGGGNPLRSRVRPPLPIPGCHRHGSVLPQQLAWHPKKQQRAEIWPKYSLRLTISFDCSSLLQRAICVCVFGWPLTDSMNYRQTLHFILADNTQIYSTVLSKHFFPTLGYT